MYKILNFCSCSSQIWHYGWPNKLLYIKKIKYVIFYSDYSNYPINMHQKVPITNILCKLVLFKITVHLLQHIVIEFSTKWKQMSPPDPKQPAKHSNLNNKLLITRVHMQRPVQANKYIRRSRLHRRINYRTVEKSGPFSNV